jgi:hypothetical protein
MESTFFTENSHILMNLVAVLPPQSGDSTITVVPRMSDFLIEKDSVNGDSVFAV